MVQALLPGHINPPSQLKPVLYLSTPPAAVRQNQPKPVFLSLKNPQKSVHDFQLLNVCSQIRLFFIQGKKNNKEKC